MSALRVVLHNQVNVTGLVFNPISVEQSGQEQLRTEIADGSIGSEHGPPIALGPAHAQQSARELQAADRVLAFWECKGETLRIVIERLDSLELERSKAKRAKGGLWLRGSLSCHVRG